MKACVRVLASVLVFTFSSTAVAYDNQTVHRKINEIALIKSRTDHFLKEQLGIRDGIYESLSTAYDVNDKAHKKIRDFVKDGGGYEDEPGCRCRNHFHDPLKAWAGAGLNNAVINVRCSQFYCNLPSHSSLVWAQQDPATACVVNFWSWPKAREYYYKALTLEEKSEREGYFSYMFRALGQVMHLIADASVPAHVRNDIHVFPLTLWGGVTIGERQTYESWTKANWPNLPYNAGSPVGASIFSRGVPQPSAPVLISALWDQNRYTGADAAVTWPGNAGAGGVGLAEFTNANFLSEDTIFTDYPHPAYGNTTAALVEQTARDGKIDHVWYVQGYTSLRLAAYSYFWDNSGLIPKTRWLFNLDSYVYEDYASQLIPRAVGYSAGLLNYFFRGDMDMMPDEEAGSGYVIVNNSDEDLEGTFELYYDDIYDKRKLAWSGELFLGPMDSGTDQSENIQVTQPEDAKDTGKYTLVFSGRIGDEADAVAGRVVNLEPDKLFLVTLYPRNIQTFAIEISDEGYTLAPAEVEIPITYSFDQHLWGRNLTIQSNPEKTSHFASVPLYGIDSNGQAVYETYSDKMTNYGVGIRDYCTSGYWGYHCYDTYAGSPLGYRPEGFTEESPYVLEQAEDLLLADRYTDPIPVALGRQSYLLDSTGKLESFQNSIWKRMVPGPCGDLPEYFFRKRTALNSPWADGAVLARDEMVQEECAGSWPGSWSITYEPVAFVGKDKALLITRRHDYLGFSSSERPLSANLHVVTTTTGMRCQLDPISVTKTVTTDYEMEATGTILQGTEQLYTDELSFGDVPLEKVKQSRNLYAENLLNLYWQPWTSVTTNEEYSAECPDPHDYPLCPPTGCETVMTRTYEDSGVNRGYFPDTYCVYCGDMQYNASSGGWSGERIDAVMGYDQKDGDQTFLLFYRKTGKQENSWSAASFYVPSLLEVRTSNKSTRQYVMAYRVEGGALAKELITQNVNTLDESSLATGYDAYGQFVYQRNRTEELTGQRVTGVSVKNNDVNMVYTYIIETWDAGSKEWVFQKRIVGIMNISDPRLPVGYRQDFAFPSQDLAFPNPGALAAIGVTR